MGCCGKKSLISTAFFLAILLVTLGLVIVLFWGSLYNRILRNELTLTNTSKSYELWKETPIPMYFSLYLFNWTNADEVLQKKWAVKPKLQECGPYVFSEHHIRENIKWNDNGTVTYQQKRIWYFLPSLSNGSLSDKITNVNPIVAVVGNKIKDLNVIYRKLVNIVLNRIEKKLVITKTVDELLFTGYTDNILNIISKLNITGFNIPFSKFGWFYARNESTTYDGTFTIYTGKTDLELLGIMDLWNGAPYTDDYNSYCALVNGTSGELWPPVQGYQHISIFSSDICSSLSLDLIGQQTIRGVTGNRFIGSDYAFDNGTKYSEQACFHGDSVVPSGTRDISRCKFSAPAFLSYPHFYLADQSYREAVKGMHPNKTIHETYFILEPNTGIPLDVRAQLQISLFIEPIPSMSIFENIKPTYMPMIWFRQDASLTEKYADMAKVLVVLPSVGLYTGWTAFVVGILFGIFGVYVIFRKNLKDRESEEQLIPGEEEEEQVQ